VKMIYYYSPLTTNRKQPWFLLPASVTVAAFGGILFGYDIGKMTFLSLIISTMSIYSNSD